VGSDQHALTQRSRIHYCSQCERNPNLDYVELQGTEPKFGFVPFGDRHQHAYPDNCYGRTQFG
jgi:hypothetical protein